jgi:transposase
MKKDIYTEENINKVVDLYVKGFPITKIKKEVGIGDKAIRKILKTNNISIRSNKDIVSTSIQQCEFEKIIQLYEDGMFQKEIAELYNVNYQVIARILKAYNIDTSTHVRRSQFSKTDIENMCSLYDDGKTLRDIGDIYHVDYTEIAFLFKKIGKKCRDSSHAKTKKYYINENFFDVVDTEEKAYILGLLWADGNNYMKTSRVQLSLQECDRDILDKIQTIMQIETPIGFIKKRNERCQNMYRLAFANKHMSDTLNELGMVPNKSLVLKFPEWLDKTLYSHFIRGYFDGDGHVSAQPYTYVCSIVSTEDFCKRVQEILADEGIVTKVQNTYNKETSTRSLWTYNKHDSKKLLDYLYKDATIYLNRKHDVYMQKYCIGTNITLTA